MSRTPAKKKSRLTLEVSTTVRERLENLRSLSDAESITEVIRRAAAVYEVLLEHKVKGYETLIRREDDEGAVVDEKSVLII